MQLVLADDDAPSRSETAWANATYEATVLAAPSLTAVNTPAAPRSVEPKPRSRARLQEPLRLPAHSFTVVTVTR